MKKVVKGWCYGFTCKQRQGGSDFKQRVQKVEKGSATRSLDPRAPPARRFRAQAVEEHGIKWFNAQKEAKYYPEIWIGEG
ncbi:hypothetical protein HAX54_032953 [Datura stramonium]|uniref:Uncharacterized protein n=1 Tax=Datura stramonium TaxID=4076 RepID=A0ABS8VC44_DATST|nr:hypothetical protein [Datura stramonium]